MNHIVDSLYVGDAEDAQAPDPQISAILWTALETKVRPPKTLTLGRIPLREYTEAVPIDIRSGVEWLERHVARHHILVACRVGMGRSVSTVIAYLCCVKEMDYDEACALLRERRTGATPLPNLEQTINKVKALRRPPS